MLPTWRPEGIRKTLWYSRNVLIESDIVPECVLGSASLGGLLTLYEANYVKLSHLVSGLASASGDCVSTVPGDLDLHVHIAGQGRYTRELRLTYLFEDGQLPVRDPDLQLRAYLDARLVEVRSWVAEPRHPALSGIARSLGRELDRRWGSNMMLSKWLDFLLDRGHGFDPRAA